MEKWIYERVTDDGRETVNEFDSLAEAKQRLRPFFSGHGAHCWEELLDEDGIKKGQLLNKYRDTGYRLYRAPETAVTA